MRMSVPCVPALDAGVIVASDIAGGFIWSVPHSDNKRLKHHSGSSLTHWINAVAVYKAFYLAMDF